MRTYRHSLISLGYAAGISLLTSGTLGDWGMYLAAFVGGELIDIIDHPLYHLVYRRKDPVVQQGFRELKQKGLKEYFRFLNKAEDNREFNTLMLHNILSLSLIALIGIFCALWLVAPIYSFVTLGAFLLHMLTDLYGDFRLKGHSDNWLWVLPTRLLERIGRIGSRFVIWVWSWWAFILFAFFLVSFRWAWQIQHPLTEFGLAYEAIHSSVSAQIWLVSAPLFFLIDYFLIVLGLIFVGSYKYRLEVSSAAMAKTSQPQSVNALWKLITRKTPQTRREFDKVLLKMQADVAVWILVLSCTIALGLLLCSWFRIDNPVVIILIATAPALTFGTLIHTTIGEFGGVLGVLLAASLNIILSRFGLQQVWSPLTGLVLFIAACGAWLLGLIGGIFLKGQRRMSLVVFLVQIKNRGAEAGSVEWLKKIIKISQQALKQGYCQARRQLFGGNKLPSISKSVNDVVLLPYSGTPLLFNDHIHFYAADTFVPLLNQIAYVLCDNHLMSTSHSAGEFGLLPVLPNYRLFESDPYHGEAHWENGKCVWHSKTRKVVFKSVQEEAGAPLVDGNVMVSAKLIGDHFDDMVTRRVDLLTDLYIFPKTDGCDLTICGISRAKTSTKEYSNIESETYAGWVQQAILDAVEENQLGESQKFAARLFYPQISQFDQGLEEFSSQNGIPILQSREGCFQPEEAKMLQQALELLPKENQIFSVSADFNQRILVLALQVALTIISSTLGMNPAVIDIIKSAF